MGGVLSLVVAGGLWGFGVCRGRGIPAESRVRAGQGAVAQRKGEEFAEAGTVGRESDGASTVIQGLWAGFGWGCRLVQAF